MGAARNLNGYKRDRHDDRDLVLKLEPRHLQLVPDEVDLEPVCPPVYNQTTLGSCTAEASLGALHFTLLEMMKQVPQLSALYQYWFTRFIEGTTKQDAGAMIRDAFKALSKYGFCDEATWPYLVKKFAQKPNDTAIVEAAGRKVPEVMYGRVQQDVDHMCAVLADRNPIVLGFTVYESFMTNAVAKSGVMPMPKKGERVEGGHAVTAIGYSKARQAFKMRNSWGKTWGVRGYFWMPFAYAVSRNASDIWTFTSAPKYLKLAA